MTENERYTVIAVDGEAADIGDFSTPSLRYDNLSWEDSVTLARLSFSQGFEVVLWKIDDEGSKAGGGGTCAKT